MSQLVRSRTFWLSDVECDETGYYHLRHDLDSFDVDVIVSTGGERRGDIHTTPDGPNTVIVAGGYADANGNWVKTNLRGSRATVLG